MKTASTAVRLARWAAALATASGVHTAHAQTHEFMASTAVCMTKGGYCVSKQIDAPGPLSDERTRKWREAPLARGSESAASRVLAGYGFVEVNAATSTQASADANTGASSEAWAGVAVTYRDTVQVLSADLPPGTPVTLRFTNLLDAALKATKDGTGANAAPAADRVLFATLELRNTIGHTLLSASWCSSPTGDKYPPLICSVPLKKKSAEQWVQDFEAQVGESLVIEQTVSVDTYALASCTSGPAKCAATAESSVKGPARAMRQQTTIVPLTPGVTVRGTSGHDWSTSTGP